MGIRNLKIIMTAFIMVLVIQPGGAQRVFEFTIIDPLKLSRFHEDRILYQHIEIEPREFSHSPINNSIASLLVIKDNNLFFFQDGYMDPREMRNNYIGAKFGQTVMPDLWENKINGKPDLLQIMHRRVVTRRLQAGEDEGYALSQEFVDQYTSIRNSFITRHVEIFRSLLRERHKSDIIVERTPLTLKYGDQRPARYITSVAAKTIDGRVYYAEDSNGDGVTDTFSVTSSDGFNWGFKSGPNIIFIYRNTQDDIKEMIGRLAHEGYYGIDDDAAQILEELVSEEDITDLMDHIYRLK